MSENKYVNSLNEIMNDNRQQLETKLREVGIEPHRVVEVVNAARAENQNVQSDDFTIEHVPAHEAEARASWKKGKYRANFAFGSTTSPAELPPFSVPIRGDKSTVEVAPGVMVSQYLINEAVRLTSIPGGIDQVERRYEKHARQKEVMHKEIKQDLETSKQIVQSMVERARQPVDMQEKYVSYDTMPSPLQRVVKAYIDAAAANKELDEAIKGLQGTPVVKAA